MLAGSGENVNVPTLMDFEIVNTRLTCHREVEEIVRREVPAEWARAAAVMGADICTCQPKVIWQMMRHPLTDIGIETVRLADKMELGRILGRAERSAVGLPAGQLADAFVAKLARYRDISGES